MNGFKAKVLLGPTMQHGQYVRGEPVAARRKHFDNYGRLYQGKRGHYIGEALALEAARWSTLFGVCRLLKAQVVEYSVEYHFDEEQPFALVEVLR